VDRRQVDALLGTQDGLDVTALLDQMVRNVDTNIGLYREHMADVFQGELIVFSAERDDDDRAGYLARRWAPHVSGAISTHRVDCTHQDMLGAGALELYGPQLRHLLDREAP
jgi:thioesterase domain-containing protein